MMIPVPRPDPAPKPLPDPLHCTGRGQGTQTGFTLVELLVVVGVIIALLGMGFPAYRAIVDAGQRDSAQALCSAVAAEIAQDGRREASFSDASGRVTLREMWDFDRNGILDGDPERDPGFTVSLPGASVDARSEARLAGYRGFQISTGMRLPAWARDEPSGRVLDPWGAPLRIAFDPQAWPPHGLRITSDGPDRQPASDDDIHSSGGQP